MKRVIVVHPDWGVCLGYALGLVFWSKLDPVGQGAAVTFADANDAKEWFDGTTMHGTFKTCQVLEVETEGDGIYATIEQCVAVGAPGWVI